MEIGRCKNLARGYLQTVRVGERLFTGREGNSLLPENGGGRS